MKRILSSSIFLLAAAVAYAQSGSFTAAQVSSTGPLSSSKLTVRESWVGLDGGGGGTTVAIDSSGNVYSAGSGGGLRLKSYSPGGQLISQTIFPDRYVSHMRLDQAEDLVIVGRAWVPSTMLAMKVRTDGTLAWETIIPYFASAIRVAMNDLGEIYFVGQSSNSNASQDYVTVKMSADGNVLWHRTYNGPNNFEDRASFLDVAPDGRVAVTGYSTGGVTSRDVATIVYDTNGNELWRARYEGPDLDEARCVAFDSTGAVYVSGFTDTGVGFGPDLLLVKYDSQGIEQWVRTYDGPISAGDYGTRIEVTSNDEVIVVGDSGGNVTINSVLLKFDSLGNLMWTRRHASGTFSEIPLATVLGSEDEIYVTGQGGANQASYITFCYGADGTLLWEQLYDSGGVGGSNRAVDIALGPLGAVAITGRPPFTTIRYREYR